MDMMFTDYMQSVADLLQEHFPDFKSLKNMADEVELEFSDGRSIVLKKTQLTGIDLNVEEVIEALLVGLVPGDTRFINTTEQIRTILELRDKIESSGFNYIDMEVDERTDYIHHTLSDVKVKSGWHTQDKGSYADTTTMFGSVFVDFRVWYAKPQKDDLHIRYKDTGVKHTLSVMLKDYDFDPEKALEGAMSRLKEKIEISIERQQQAHKDVQNAYTHTQA